jgi:cyanophycinase-like exopeptidase
MVPAVQAQDVEPGKPPNIRDDFYGLPCDGSRLEARVGVLDNDTLPQRGWQLRVSGKPQAGKLTQWNEQEGTFTYEAGKSWSGTDRFHYEVWLEGKPVGSAQVTIGTDYRGYRYYVDASGRPAREPGRHGQGGFLLVGGVARQLELDRAFAWLIQQGNAQAPADGDNSRGCRVLILAARASGKDVNGEWMRQVADRHHLRLYSVETLVFNNGDAPTARQAARHDPFVRQKLNEADVLFLPGGDQLAYVDLWRDSQIQEILNRRITEGNLVVGGSSAGLHVLGEPISIPLHRVDVAPSVVSGQQGISSCLALRDPQQLGPLLHWGFLHEGPLAKQRVLTDSHFHERNDDESEINLRGRMGRLVAFLAWMSREKPSRKPVHGLGIDEVTALMVSPDGKATVAGKSCAYFVTAPGSPPRFHREAGRTLLTWEGVRVIKVRAGGVFDLEHWKLVSGGEEYSISVRGGAMTHEAASRDVYNEQSMASP